MKGKKIEKPELLPTERIIHVGLKGMAPGLMMNNPESMIPHGPPKGKKTAQYDPKEEAEIRAYRDADGNLCLYDTHIKGTMLKASGLYRIKMGKGRAISIKPLIAGTVHVWPSKVSLGTKDYEIDTRPCVVQQSRIMRCRPKLSKWEAEFDLIYDQELIPYPDQLRDILTDAGRRVGLLEFRPEHAGEFGRFQVTKWQP